MLLGSFRRAEEEWKGGGGGPKGGVGRRGWDGENLGREATFSDYDVRPTERPLLNPVSAFFSPISLPHICT